MPTIDCLLAVSNTSFVLLTLRLDDPSLSSMQIGVTAFFRTASRAIVATSRSETATVQAESSNG